MKTRKTAVLMALALLASCALLGLVLRFWPYIPFPFLRQGAQGKMRCWVRVVDQDGGGVSNYKCRVVERWTPLLPFLSDGSRVRFYETGPEGTFEYRSIGAVSLVFFGYDWGSQWALNPRHLMERHNLGIYSRELAHAMREKPIGYLGSKDNPYLIRVFSTGSPQKLLYSKIRANLKEQGNYFCIDILSGRSWESKSPEGDIALADLHGPKSWDDREAFRRKLRIVAGKYCGMVPGGDIWGLAPPQEGYLGELYWPMDWEDRKCSLDFFHFYYRITGRDGTPLYGRLQFEIRGKVEGADIRCFTNLQGERNLYYDGYIDIPNQIIRDFVSPSVQ